MEIITQVTVDNSYFLKSVMMIEKTRKTPKNEFTRSTEFSDGQILDEKPLRVHLISF